jgi:hypothetical protein
VRIALVLLMCLGLALPSARGIALCIGCDGSVALEMAVDGACARSQSRSCCPPMSGGEEIASHQQRIEAHGRHGSSHDALPGRDAAPPAEMFSGKRKLSGLDSGAVVTDAVAVPFEQPTTEAKDTRTSGDTPFPPFLSTVVLQL